jgi:hypothetical protein
MNEEKIYFEYEDVKVTNARFISGSQTFAMSNVTSVKAFEKKPSRLGGILVLLVGLLCLGAQAFIGVLIMLAAGFYLYKQKTVFHVMLATASGESSALVTYQRDYLNKVVAALNEAIVRRG